jgi:hypothetical protein
MKTRFGGGRKKSAEVPMRAVCVVLVAFLFAMAVSARPSSPHPEHNVTDQELVYQVPGMDKVAVKTGIPYKRTDSNARIEDGLDTKRFWKVSSPESRVLQCRHPEARQRREIPNFFATESRKPAESGSIPPTFGRCCRLPAVCLRWAARDRSG